MARGVKAMGRYIPVRPFKVWFQWDKNVGTWPTIYNSAIALYIIHMKIGKLTNTKVRSTHDFMSSATETMAFIIIISECILATFC